MNASVAVTTVIFGLVAMELALRAWFPMFDPYGALRRVDHRAYVPRRHRPSSSMRAQPEPGLNAMEGVRTFSINRWGFRGDDLEITKPTGEARVFLLGGSTMECALADDGSSPARQLQDRLDPSAPGVKVENAAHSGDASYDHVAVFTQRIAHFNPDVVVWMAGLNDLRAAAEGRDYLHLDAHDPLEYSSRTLLELGATRLQLGRRVWALFADHGRLRLGEDAFLGRVSVTNYRAAAEACALAPEGTDELSTREGYYRDNLLTLIGAARAHDAAVVLVTQASTWPSTDPLVKSWHWLRCVGGRRYDGLQLAALLERYNDVTRAVAAEASVPLVDLARQLPPTLDHFYDDAHLSDVGVRALVEALVPPVTKVLAERSPRSQ